MPELPKHIKPTHRVIGYIEFDVPADDCAMVKIAYEAATKDIGGHITAFNYERDDHVDSGTDAYLADIDESLHYRGWRKDD